MEKNEKEKKILYDWGVQNSSGYQFREMDTENESYFIKRGGAADRNSYIREYGFETLPELEKELHRLWGDDTLMQSIRKMVTVAAMKNKVEKESSLADDRISGDTEKKPDQEEKLPMYIYNF